jgi:hypothetical protein
MTPRKTNARFASTCAGCGKAILPGDRIRVHGPRTATHAWKWKECAIVNPEPATLGAQEKRSLARTAAMEVGDDIR